MNDREINEGVNLYPPGTQHRAGHTVAASPTPTDLVFFVVAVL